MKLNTTMKNLTALTLVMFSTYLSAQQAENSPTSEHKLQIGLAGVTSQSLYLDGENQTRIFPAIDYQYKRLFFQAGDLGFNLIDQNNWEIDFGLGINLIGDTERGDSRLLENLPELSLPLNAFVSTQYKSPIGLFKVKHNHEINNKHNGNSTSISYSAPIFKDKWLFLPQVSYEHYSDEVVNYFFGVEPVDASIEIPSYQAGSTKTISLSVLGLYKINDKWSFVGNLQNEFAGDEISDSPIVNDDQRLSVFAGFLYKVF